MEKKINWGILATGNIAHQFVKGLQVLPQANIVSVGSRTQSSADQFGEQYNIPNRHGSYEALANDPAVDVIYISTPHPMHYENTLLCLNAGKHVLCEKALALNGKQVAEMIELAKEKNLFFMEAMWMWFFPAIQKTKELLHNGVIGDPQLITASFGFYKSFDAQHRLFNPELGGGALLDIGIYPLALALDLFGVPALIRGEAVLGKTLVDEQISMHLQYEDQRTANLTASIRAFTPCEAEVCGTEGFIRLEKDFWHPRKLTITKPDEEKQTLEFSDKANGYEYEAQHVMDCITAGKIESDVMSWQASMDLMAMMDTLRSAWGIRYPAEHDNVID